jgi:hypothetical protein
MAARDIGKNIVSALMPDARAAIEGALPSNITLGSIKQVYATSEAAVKAAVSGATNIIDAKGAVSSASAKATTAIIPTSTKARKGVPNALEEFASYTTLFTFACLNKEEVNNPYLYRQGKFSDQQIVFSSAGRYDKERVRTAYGSPEYYVDNINIQSVIAPNEGTGASNATAISFEIVEPYSAGLFLQSLQVVSVKSGYLNYLDGTPFMLKMEFLGYKDNGALYSGVQPKYFLMTLKKCTFSVSEKGSVYQCEAVPYNQMGFSSLINAVNNDIAITGSTVKELLSGDTRSLQAVLNEREAKSVTNKLIEIPDVYEIIFPASSSDPIPGISRAPAINRAQSNVANNRVLASSAAKFTNAEFTSNPIGNASFGFKIDSGGNYVAPTAGSTVDEATGKIVRDKVTIDPKTRTFQYGKDQTLTAIISQAILASEYCSKAVKEKPDSQGRISWFRIDVQIQLLEFDKKRGNYAKRYIYRIVPYKTHASIFTNPQALPVGYNELEKSIVKQYDYIFTGQNNDVLRFDVILDMAFYTAIAPTAPGEAGRSANTDVQSSGQPIKQDAKVQDGQAGLQAPKNGGIVVKQDPAAIKLPFGGSGELTAEEVVANNFHKAFLENGQANLVSVNLEILGDPYWLTDNGIGGYIPGPGFSDQITVDGTANYEAGDIYVYLRFRTPVEPKEAAGDYIFVGDSESPFSGIYKVIKCQNTFNSGVFKQTLDCIRMPLQASDFDEKIKPTAADSQLYNLKDPIPEKSTVYDADDTGN